jgi:death-on-curing protein
MSEPKWLEVELILRLHDRQIEEHGGLSGIRDAGLLESAVMRPLNAHAYGETDVFVLASMYAGGLINNHPFLDGNKRTGFLAALLFLRANGFRLAAPMPQRLAYTWQLAAGEVSEDQYADWLRENCEPVA